MLARRRATLVGVLCVTMVACNPGGPTGYDGSAGDGDATDAAGRDGGIEDSDLGADGGQRPWITIAANRRYFVFSDGEPFLPLGRAISGHELNFDTFGTLALGPVGYTYEPEGPKETYTFDPDSLEKLFVEMRDHGENFLRIDIEGFGWWSREEVAQLLASDTIGLLEKPAGSFSASYAARIDRLIALAERYGIYLDLVLMAHTCQLEGFRDLFDLHPYHQSQGGPLASLDAFFTDPEARALYKGRIEYIVDRWGGSPAIFTWELYNELTGCGGASDAANKAWIEEMSDHLRRYELAQYGRSHLVSISPPGFIPSQSYFHELAGTDIAITHYYAGSGSCDSHTPYEPAAIISDALPDFLGGTVAYRWPHLENERGSVAWPKSLAEEIFHHTAWAEFASGSAGAGAAWSTMERHVPDGPVAGTAYMLGKKTHRAMRTILGSLDLNHFDSRPWRDKLTAEASDIHAVGVGDGKTVVAWLVHVNVLDYRIDAIRALAQEGSSPTTLLARLDALGDWWTMLVAAGAALDVSSFAASVANVFVLHAGATAAEAQTLAHDILTAPCAFNADHATALARIGNREAFAADMEPIVLALYDYLLKQEETYKTLDQYGGHAAVTTTLTLSGLCAGTHDVVFYDDREGNELGRVTKSGSTITVEVPAFSRHTALVLSSPGCT